MNLELVLRRLKDSFPTRTPGELFVNGVFFCYSVEDEVREIPGQPVLEWKIPGQTAIPAGRYELTLEDSPTFGRETLTIKRVEGFTGVRMHSGNDERHTEGCPLLGYELTREGTITVGQTKAAVANLKRNVKAAIAAGGRCFIDVRNPV
jgi:hypothetical protein